MPQPERRLSLVHAGPEQLELERRVQVSKLGRSAGAHAETALPYARKGVVVFPVLIVERRQLGDAQRVEPVWVDCGEVVAHVEHREAVDLHRRLGILCIALGPDIGGHQEQHSL